MTGALEPQRQDLPCFFSLRVAKELAADEGREKSRAGPVAEQTKMRLTNGEQLQRRHDALIALGYFCPYY